MKARVKGTGKIVEVEDCGSVFRHGALFHGYKDANGIKYLPDEIELQMNFDYREACHDEAPEHIPDYWTRLKHQYAGMAMQVILACEEWKISPREGVSFAGEVALQAQEIAHALVGKMKEERK